MRKISELYKSVSNCEELAVWLDYYFDNGYDAFVVSEMDTEHMLGTLNSVFFRIDYDQSNRIFLKIGATEYEDVDKETITLLKNAIMPVVWNFPIKKKNTPSVPIIEYAYVGGNLEYNVLVWDTENPMDSLKEFAKWMICNTKNVRGLTIYPKYYKKFLNMLNDSKEYSVLDDKCTQLIDNASEVELFIMIKTVKEALDEIDNQFEGRKISGEAESYYKCQLGLMQCMFLRTPEFGVEKHSPAFIGDISQAQYEWYAWWDDAFYELKHKNPNYQKDWEKFEGGFDPNFRPSHDLKEFAKVYREMQEYDKQQAEAKKLASNLKKYADQKEQEEAWSKTPFGRAKLISSAANKKVAEIMKEIEEDPLSPFEKF